MINNTLVLHGAVQSAFAEFLQRRWSAIVQLLEQANTLLLRLRGFIMLKRQVQKNALRNRQGFIQRVIDTVPADAERFCIVRKCLRGAAVHIPVELVKHHNEGKSALRMLLPMVQRSVCSFVYSLCEIAEQSLVECFSTHEPAL